METATALHNVAKLMFAKFVSVCKNADYYIGILHKFQPNIYTHTSAHIWPDNWLLNLF